MERQTRQRTAILKSLSQYGRPLSTAEILAYTSVEVPEINLSTIYRNIKKLLEEKKINTVDLPQGNARYEIAEGKHHHYFLCDRCDKLFSILGCPNGLIDLIPKGFRLKSHSIILSGFCKDCA
jgi:Fur family ferric uptake transcriptional regulator